MVVVLTLMGVLAGIGGLAFAGLRRPAEDPWSGSLSAARQAAIDSGITVLLAADSVHAPVLLLPDGRAVGKGVDPFTGEALRVTR
jgi:hypothetical protein